MSKPRGGPSKSEIREIRSVNAENVCERYERGFCEALAKRRAIRSAGRMSVSSNGLSADAVSL
jgi:hypothetical protein